MPATRKGDRAFPRRPDPRASPSSGQNDEIPLGGGISMNRLKGFEPSTFCMATRPGSLACSVRKSRCPAESARTANLGEIADAAICGISGTLGGKCPGLGIAVKGCEKSRPCRRPPR